MKKVLFVFAFVFFSIFKIFTQELGINVDQLLGLKRGFIEKTSDEDKSINRQHFVFGSHPDDPNYGMIYTQDYEEEYFFINNKLYFIVKEYRAMENKWKYLLYTYIDKKYEYTERTDSTPDGSWYINIFTFYNETEQYQVFIYRPSQRWNTVYKFAPGEVLVRIVGRHNQYLREYQNAISERK